MAGKSTSGNFTLRRGRKFRRKFTLDDDTARKLRELHNLTMLSEDEIVRLLILHASGETLSAQGLAEEIALDIGQQEAEDRHEMTLITPQDGP